MKGVIILANTEFDSCLAASLVIENLNYIQGIKYRHPTLEELENQSDDDDDDDDDDDIFLRGYQPNFNAKQLPEGAIISNLDTDLDISFCDESEVITNAWKVTSGYALVFLIGYSEQTFRKMIDSVLYEDQEIMSLEEIYSCLLLSELIDWGPRKDHWTNLRIAASMIWQQDYMNFAIDLPYLIGKKMRKEAEKIIDNYRDSWKIAYNLYSDDPENLHLFFVEFMNEVANDVTSQFIKELIELEPELTKETLKISKQITDQGQGIGFVRAGTKKFFKTDTLLKMTSDGFCHSVIEYKHNDQVKTLNSTFRRQVYVLKGAFKKDSSIGQN